MLAIERKRPYYTYMPKPKFETQPFYEDAIMDMRVQEVFGELTAKAHIDAIEERRNRPLFPSTRPQPIHAAEKAPFVHEIEQMEYVGSDGETGSGFIELLRVTPDHGSEVAVINAHQFDHETGVPYEGRSWCVEFNDVALAKTFWGKKWQPNFGVDNVVTGLLNFIKEKPQLVDNVEVTRMGLLKPWVLQRANELRFLGKFSTTVSNQLVEIPGSHAPSPDFRVGQVYVVPITAYFTTKPHDFAAKTCLAAFYPAGAQVRDIEKDNSSVLIQWSDGELGYYRKSEPTRMPFPLTKAHIARPKATPR